jgi:hypothetical protein
VCFVMGLSIARPQLLRMISWMARNHAGANASLHHVLENRARVTIRRPTMRAGGLGGGPCKIEETKREHFPFRWLVLPPSR